MAVGVGMRGWEGRKERGGERAGLFFFSARFVSFFVSFLSFCPFFCFLRAFSFCFPVFFYICVSYFYLSLSKREQRKSKRRAVGERGERGVEEETRRGRGGEKSEETRSLSLLLALTGDASPLRAEKSNSREEKMSLPFLFLRARERTEEEGGLGGERGRETGVQAVARPATLRIKKRRKKRELRAPNFRAPTPSCSRLST